MNKFLIDEPTVISFSGGRTSAYMLWRVLQAHGGKLPPEAIVCFANTGKEDEATLRFVDRCSKEWNVDIVWLEFRDNELKFDRVTFETASRNGEPFETLIIKRKFLPNPISRFCTVELKVRTIHRYLKSIGIDEAMNMIGIRADEQRRLVKISNNDYGNKWPKSAPLGPAGITKENVGEFWRNQKFDLELPNINGVTKNGNCDLCFLKGTQQIMSLVSEKPERAIWWAKMETLVQTSNKSFGDGGRFRKDRPGYSELAKFIDKQGDFFGHDESIECFCGD
jgi:3'-phosphoadenosine 5'-phosphosulfate sulfotransferase (PAPS reductase)/FAD synthetase